MKLKRPDWNNYRHDFPDRYLKEGPFDKFVTATIQALLRLQPKGITALDIGGGTKGTPALHKRGITCIAVDPYVKTLPTWQKKSTWAKVSSQRFDLIVLRGSFNYLTLSQLRKLPELLKPEGIVLFNTFAEPKDMARPATNGSRTNGGECAFYLPDSQIIKHVMVWPNKPVIVHHFHYRSPKLLKTLFGDKLTLVPSKGNSLIGKIIAETK